jgi:hypothetical protein
LQQHIKELSKIITPDHKDLKIPKMYHLECPWPAAQRELYMINAYKVCLDWSFLFFVFFSMQVRLNKIQQEKKFYFVNFTQTYIHSGGQKPHWKIAYPVNFTQADIHPPLYCPRRIVTPPS